MKRFFFSVLTFLSFTGGNKMKMIYFLTPIVQVKMFKNVGSLIKNKTFFLRSQRNYCKNHFISKKYHIFGRFLSSVRDITVPEFFSLPLPVYFDEFSYLNLDGMMPRPASSPLGSSFLAYNIIKLRSTGWCRTKVVGSLEAYRE